MEFLDLWTQLLFGREMEKYTFSKENIIGDLIRKKGLLYPKVILGMYKSICRKVNVQCLICVLTFRPISNWEGIPDDVDDAVQYDNGFTYFFKKGDYYRFNDRYFKVGSRILIYKSYFWVCSG